MFFEAVLLIFDRLMEQACQLCKVAPGQLQYLLSSVVLQQYVLMLTMEASQATALLKACVQHTLMQLKTQREAAHQ